LKNSGEASGPAFDNLHKFSQMKQTYLLSGVFLSLFCSCVWAIEPSVPDVQTYERLRDITSEDIRVFGDVDPQIQIYELIPNAICTEMFCLPEKICCNSCQINGWREKGSGVLAESVGVVPFPYCGLNGCGECPFTLHATGYFDDLQKPSKIYVKTWDLTPENCTTCK